jgi:hypothetical protein
MGSRERKRAERRKRKERRPDAERSGDGSGASESPSSQTEIASRAEARNQQAREALEPLHEGERPGAVTIGAVISTLIAASIVIAYVAGAEVDGDRPAAAQVIAPTLIMGMTAYGMWRARYWAVLGFQVILVFLILAASFGLLQAASVRQAIGNTVLLALAGSLFWFMVKALARIQMPRRLPRD